MKNTLKTFVLLFFVIVIGCKKNDNNIEPETTNNQDLTIQDYEYEQIDLSENYFVREYSDVTKDHILEIYGNIDAVSNVTKINQIVVTDNLEALVLNFDSQNILNRFYIQKINNGQILSDYYIIQQSSSVLIQKQNETPISIQNFDDQFTYQLFEFNDANSSKLKELMLNNDKSLQAIFSNFISNSELNNSSIKTSTNSSNWFSKLKSYILNKINEDQKNNPKIKVESRRSTCIGIRGRISNSGETYRCNESTDDERRNSIDLITVLCNESEICSLDCNGDIDGTATLDDCNVCTGGNTGSLPNETCLDCNGIPNGSATIDNCGVCSGGNTGITANSTCPIDCNGDFNGNASLDNCNICSGGLTGIVANANCVQDCNGDIDGTASLDSCNICSGGNTGIVPCVIECVTDSIRQGEDCETMARRLGLTGNFSYSGCNTHDGFTWPGDVVTACGSR